MSWILIFEDSWKGVYMFRGMLQESVYFTSKHSGYHSNKDTKGIFIILMKQIWEGWYTNLLVCCMYTLE